MKSFPQRCTPWSLHGPSTLNDIDQYHHDRDDQENVNESTHRVRGDQTYCPEDKQNDGDGPEHFSSPPAVIQRQAFTKKWYLRNYPAEQSLVSPGGIPAGLDPRRSGCGRRPPYPCLLYTSPSPRD